MNVNDHSIPTSQSTRLLSSKNGEKHKKNISAQPPIPAANINNEYDYYVDDEESKKNLRSVRKPNPTLAPLSQKMNNVPDLSNRNKIDNMEAMMPSVDELRKRRGELMPLNRNALLGMNNSFDSQKY